MNSTKTTFFGCLLSVLSCVLAAGCEAARSDDYAALVFDLSLVRQLLNEQINEPASSDAEYFDKEVEDLGDLSAVVDRTRRTVERLSTAGELNSEQLNAFEEFALTFDDYLRSTREQLELSRFCTLHADDTLNCFSEVTPEMTQRWTTSYVDVFDALATAKTELGD